MRDVFPGCKSYSGQDSGSQWGDICAATIATFDKNQTLPKNIGSAVHPIYYFEPPPSGCKPSAYVLYVPPTGMLPIAATHGRYEYFLFQYLREQMNIAVFVLQVPEAGSDLWDHVPPHATGSPYAYDCAKIKSDYDYCFPTCDMCMRNRSTDIIDAAIDTAHRLGYTEQIVMGWSSGGAMASAFLDHAHAAGFVTAVGRTKYIMRGLALLSSGGQFCYAYDNVADLKRSPSTIWGKCTAAKPYGCCPEGLTEDFYYRHPTEYPRHPPTLLVQSVIDEDADSDAARFYHAAMVKNKAESTHFRVGGANHNLSPPVFGVVASWIQDVLSPPPPGGGMNTNTKS